MDLTQLRTFLAIAEEGSLSRAAKRIYLSQPAVSGQLKLLEEELGLRLFERTPKGMVLTVAGHTILVDVRRTLTAAGEVALRARSLKDNQIEVFRLGTISEPTILRITQTLYHLMENHRNIRLEITQGISGKIIDAVLDGAVDAGYVIGEVDNPRLRVLTVAPIVLRVAVPRSLWDEARNVPFAGLGDLPWVSTPPECSFNRIMGRMFTREGIQPPIILKADQETTLAEMVTSEIGLTLLREDIAFQAEARGELYVWRNTIERSELNFIYPTKNEEDPIMKAMTATIRKTWDT